MEGEDVIGLFGAAVPIGSGTAETEKEFETVLELMRDAEGLKYFSDVYTKLYDSYYKMKEQNYNNLQEIESMNARMGRFDETISDYLKELSQANATIEKQRIEIEEAKALADAMHARELQSVESLETLKKTLGRIEKELDAMKRAGDDDPGASSAVKEKEKFEKEKAALQGELDALRMRLSNAVNYQEELEAKTTAQEEEISRLEQANEECENNAIRNGRLMDLLKSEQAGFKAEVEQRGIVIGTLTEKLTKAEKTLERRDKQIKDLTTKMEQAKAEAEAAIAKTTQFREQLDNTLIECEKNKIQLVNTTKELKNMIEGHRHLRNEISKLTKNLVSQTKKYQRMEQTKSAIESDRERLRQQIIVMEREIQIGTKQAESDRREIENLNREKDILNKTMQKIQIEAQENLNIIGLQESRHKQQEHELELNARQINKQRLIIRQMEKDKDRSTVQEEISTAYK